MARFVISDTETSGTSTRHGQIFQFAAIVTDEAFNEIETLNLRCRRLPQILPAPMALKVTGIDPHSLAKAPLSYFEMARLVHAKFTQWAPATFMGYNSLSFDEEIQRQMFWMNLLDPYVTNTKGSARADLLEITRTAVALKPEILKVRTNEETGSPIFRLEVLAPDNGFENHAAHDALGDIRATIFIAKLVRERAPEVWEALMRNTRPDAVEALLSDPIVLLMTHFGQPRFMPATRVCMHPTNKRQALMFDLSQDPTPWLDMPAEALKEEFVKPGNPFQRLKTNAMPTVFSLADPAAAAKAGEVADPLAEERRFAIATHPTFRDACAAALKAQAESWGPNKYLEDRIYEGFPSYKDKDRMQAFHAATDWAERASIASGFADDRLRQLATRILWANAPQVLDAEIVAAIDAAVATHRLLSTDPEAPWDTFAGAKAQLAEIDGHPLAPAIAAWYDGFERAIAEDPAAVRTYG